jgi:hypothetical protein
VVTRFAMAAATLVVLHFVAGAAAQSLAHRVSSDLGEAPVAIGGWRHIKGPKICLSTYAITPVVRRAPKRALSYTRWGPTFRGSFTASEIWSGKYCRNV